MAKREQLTGVTYTDELGRSNTMVPLRCDDDGAWWVLDSEGVSYWADPADLERFADEMPDDDLADVAAAYREMAAIMREAVDG